jgi:hypothetical protein
MLLAENPIMSCRVVQLPGFKITGYVYFETREMIWERNKDMLTKIKEMNDSQIQDWLRKVGQENAAKLAVAMLGMDEDVRKMIYRNMSQHAATHLQDDVEMNKKAIVDKNTISTYAVDLEKLV